MTNKRIFRTWVEISDKAILGNIRTYKNILGPSVDIMPVIKSNAYGHGAVRVAKLLEQTKVPYFAVVFLEEALALRNGGIETPILVFSTNLFDTAMVIEAIQKDITFTIYNKDSCTQLNHIAKKVKKKALVHVNIDTGMTRLGFRENEYRKTIAKVCASEYLTIQGIYSHLSSADSNMRYTHAQCMKFKKAVAEAEASHCHMQYKHILNTPGSMLGIPIGNIARIGRGIYGLPPSKSLMERIRTTHDKKISLARALTWKTRVMQVHHVEKNTSIGYNGTYITKKKSDIATLPIGFADGYPRLLSNRGEVLIKGKRCPVRGRVCMNNIIVDVSAVRGSIRPGDEVTIIGTNGKETITPADIAEKARTTQSEIVATIPEHIPRI